VSAVTQILSAIDQGDPRAAAALLPLVYDELRRLAAARLAREPSGLTLQATALVHEAYLRLVGNDDPTAGQRPSWNSRGHFFAAAAEAMRRILVDNARRRNALKRGGGATVEPLDEDVIAVPEPREDLIALDEALDRLAKRDPDKARLVTLRYFGGLTLKEAAAALHISEATADRHWAYARAWLHQAMTADT
jgi:RNA polymerase sigma factor (TIGR02999 family)